MRESARGGTRIEDLLQEIDNDVLSRRFEACKAIEAGIWAYGLRTCTTPIERAEWVCRYMSHLESLCTAWHSANAQESPLTSALRKPGGSDATARGQ